MVCRDCHGNYMGSSSLIIPGLQDASTLETIACREALALAEDLAIKNFVVASDAQQVVNDIARGSRGRQAVIIEEIKIRARKFNCTLSFESRLVNEDAHKLARFSLSLAPGRHIWLLQPHNSNVIPLSVVFDE